MAPLNYRKDLLDSRKLGRDLLLRTGSRAMVDTKRGLGIGEMQKSKDCSKVAAFAVVGRHMDWASSL